jgi:uncharacterized protein (TIGR03067 family)
MREGEAASLAKLRSLQGRWREIWRTDRDGATQPFVQSQALTVFSGNTFSVKVPGRDPTSQGNFVIDVASEPRSITLIFALEEGLGKRAKGFATCRATG